MTYKFALLVSRSVSQCWLVTKTKYEHFFVITLLPTHSQLGGVYTALFEKDAAADNFAANSRILPDSG